MCHIGPDKQVVIVSLEAHKELLTDNSLLQFTEDYALLYCLYVLLTQNKSYHILTIFLSIKM